MTEPNDGEYPPDTDHENIDMGEPIRELSNLLEAPRAGFRRRVSASIHRRVFVSQVADLSLLGFFESCLGYLEMIFESFGGRRGEDGERHRE